MNPVVSPMVKACRTERCPKSKTPGGLSLCTEGDSPEGRELPSAMSDRGLGEARSFIRASFALICEHVARRKREEEKRGLRAD